MPSPRWIAWTPSSSRPHITAQYTERVYDYETRAFEPQTVHAHCGKCNAVLKHECASGRPREWIARFALVHRHDDA
jgi:hypothetical protein